MSEHLDLPGTFCLFTEQVAKDQDWAERTFHVAEAKVGQALHQGWEGARVPEDSGARVPRPCLSTAPSLHVLDARLMSLRGIWFFMAGTTPTQSIRSSLFLSPQSYSELE